MALAADLFSIQPALTRGDSVFSSFSPIFALAWLYFFRKGLAVSERRAKPTAIVTPAFQCFRRTMPRSISAIRCTSRAITTSSRASVNLANRHDPNLNLARLPESLMQHIGINTNDFQLYPDFFDAKQQSTLLSSALALMNRKASVEERSHLRAWRSRNRGYKTAPGSFLPVCPLVRRQSLLIKLQDEAYAFEQSHFDTVITGFREVGAFALLELG